MIKKLISTAVLVLSFSVWGFAQKVTKKATIEICDCFQTIHTDSSASFVREKATNCLTDGVSENLSGLMKENKVKDLDENGGQQLGETLANKLLKDCPVAASVFMKIASQPSAKKE